jgi:imidazolonepropionase-like amidohydrolase
LGIVAVGAQADLVVIDGDPLADLAAIHERGPAMVLKQGRVVRSTP